MFIMRFDMRSPGIGNTTTAELYAAALDMAVWGEENGALQIVVSEHHGSSDDYLPSPLVLASAMAARTSRIEIQIGALIVPLHDPLRLAEDIAVLDLISSGRVTYVMAVGYVEREYRQLDRPFKGRGKRMDECLEAIRNAFTGESFEYQGRMVRIRPTPMTPGGPTMLMGGNSKAAARRAARFGMGMLAQGLNPELEGIYRAACEEQGITPGPCINPPPNLVTSGFVARDPDEAWAKLGPYLLHDARAYAAWMGDATSISKSVANTVEELRAQQGAYRIFTPEEAVDYMRSTGVFLLQPLCGGLDPDLAWECLDTFKADVLPKLG
ncbi:MAG: LLM class flavin-dependent oxidoreductase [Myxococcota bacterium]|jgi:alkanesulfonate monooxygenase SsuD/methylene tetrahydromethanopterin reductase-like flavin-dependent oxidoreductase (luciferase family)|nr:LLM class flavin-dependent oxidoreductase [Myxococcota bacterium]